MKTLKTALAGVLCLLMLVGCSSQKNYDNTAATNQPQSTDSNTVRDDAGNMVDDAGNVVEDAGDAVGDAAKDVGDTIKR